MRQPNNQSKKLGRPSKRSPQLASQLCLLLASGFSLRAACKQHGFPSTEFVRRWLLEDEIFCAQYVRAREEQAEYYADEIVHIADSEDDPNKAKVRVDARKWVAAKLLPKKYGDRTQEISVNNTVNLAVMTEERRAELIERRKLLTNGHQVQA